MNTPILDFVRAYARGQPMRLHMPGHKGVCVTGPEELDITEVGGADSLYEADGIILESEKNASALFGSHTFYSVEGSSLSIRAMVYLATLWAKEQGRCPLILAGRNAHRSFLSAVSLCRVDVAWLWPEGHDTYLSCPITPNGLRRALSACQEPPVAVYLTTPDYLGHMVDLAALASVCHAYGTLLLVDNAHGAYLKFLSPSHHPIDLGADLCCDSAHKTLPVLTGGAYLHISNHVSPWFAAHAKAALALFASTSPSYLILQSLDAANVYLAKMPKALSTFLPIVGRLRTRLLSGGYMLVGDEPCKITIMPKPYGYTGQELADILRAQHVECEFADLDHLVLMLSPSLPASALAAVGDVLLAVPRRQPVLSAPPLFVLPEVVLPPYEAAFLPQETLPLSDCAGRVLASSSLGCPPAVPIVAAGERMGAESLAVLRYYGIKTCSVLKEYQ